MKWTEVKWSKVKWSEVALVLLGMRTTVVLGQVGVGEANARTCLGWFERELGEQSPRTKSASDYPTIALCYIMLPPRVFYLVLVQTIPNRYAQWIHRSQLALGQQWSAYGAMQWPTARPGPSMRPAGPNPRPVLGASGEPAGRLGGASVARYADYGHPKASWGRRIQRTYLFGVVRTRTW